MSEKTCAIVGAGPGVGLAVARRFGREGYRLALVARREAKLAGYVAELASEGIAATGFAADASSLSDLANAFQKIKSELAAPEVLIYNAAAIMPTVPSDLAAEQMVAEFMVNVAAALVCAQQVIPEMKAAGQGTILFTGGGLALRPNPQYASLAVGKAGLRNLTFSLAQELEPAGIHVATVTIAGFVQPGTPFDPNLIAEEYWRLHIQEKGQWEQEFIYKA